MKIAVALDNTAKRFETTVQSIAKKLERLINMRKIAYFVLFNIIAVTMLSGCAFINNDSFRESNVKESYMLNDRQKEILKQEGLPTNFNELSLSKKIAIEAIEDMFQYLDNQYPDEKFEYAEYISQSSLEKEQLLVKCQYGEVTVMRDITGDIPIYEDDFTELRASDMYETIINQFLSKSVDERTYIVSVVVNKYNGDAIVEDSILQKCSASITIFVNEDIGEEQFQNIVTILSKYLGEKVGSNSVSADFYLVNNSDFNIDLPDKYTTSINMDIFLRQISYYHRANGDEKLYEVER